jgi:hypothetical protein
MEDKTLYQDSLIEIKEDSMILKKYYFPSMSSKKILFIAIEKIETKQPSLISGKWRIHGTGDFRTWFPLDSSRPKRDKIFFIKYKNKWMKSGFTVEDSEKVENILIQKDLIK